MNQTSAHDASPVPAQPAAASRLRILYLIDAMYTDSAGTENQLLKLVRELGPRHEVTLVCLQGGASPWLRENSPALPCRVHFLDFGSGGRGGALANLLRLRALLRAVRPQLVHTFFPVANSLGVLVARLAGVRPIVASRRDLGIWMSPRYLAVTRVANRWVGRIIVNSSEVKRLTVEKEGFDGARIDVVHNGVDLDLYRRRAPDPALRASLGLTAGNLVVGLVANFRRVKRNQSLVLAAEQIARRRTDIDFLLVGGAMSYSEDYRGQTIELARRLGLEQRVHFCESDGNVPQLLGLCDIAVNCSEHEGLSNAVIEYMAAQVPCVVSAAGGNLDLITNGDNGLTFPYDDIDQLARHIEFLADHPAERQRLAQAAYARVQSEMAVGAMIARTEGVYRRLLADAR